MIEKEQLKEICTKYNINYEKLIKNNLKILEYGEYESICKVLNFLRDEVKIDVRNIEKCPSILYYAPENIEANWEFLNEKQITNYSIEGCLHILSTEHAELVKTYNYIIENYGVRYLNVRPSILRVPVARIKKIEIKFQSDFKPQNFLQAAYSNFSIEEIEKIVKVCKENKIEITGTVLKKSAEEIQKIVKICEQSKIKITGSVFIKTAEEIEKIVKVCKENEIEITGRVFKKKAEEIEEIIRVCRENNIEITGNVFQRTAKEIEELVEVCRENNIEITGSVFDKTAEEIEKIVKVCEENKIEITGTVFSKSANEIEEIVKVCKENGIEITGNVFLKTAEEIRKIVKVCRENEIEIKGNVFLKPAEEIEEIVKVCRKNGVEITGTVFHRTAKEIEKIVKVCKENGVEITGSVFKKTAKEIEEIVRVCKENKIEITGSVFNKTPEEIEKIVKICRDDEIEITGSVFKKSAKALEKNIEYIKSNYGEEFLKPLIVSKNYEQLITVLPYLKEKGVLHIVINSASILNLKLSEIQEREKYIEQIGEKILTTDGKAFNSIFGLTRKIFKEKSKRCSTRKITGDEIGEAVSDVVENIDIVDATQEAMNSILNGKEEKEGNL